MSEFPSGELPQSSGPVPEDGVLVEIPADRRHQPAVDGSLRGIPLATLVAVVGSAVVGAGYGAFIALCGETFVNITVAFAFPFWMLVPSHLGLMWGHLHHQKWRSRIELLGFLVCLYAVCVGWLAAVLDGPGVVLNPLQLAGCLTDTSTHSIWVLTPSFIDVKPELPALAPYLGVIRGTEMFWIVVTGLMCRGAATPFPYCHSCRRWMQDAATLRLKYQPESLEQVRQLATELVAEQYESLLQLDEPVEPDAKGLEVSVFACEGCGARHVMDLRWYREKPDADRTETEQLLESAAGIGVVSGLKIPCEVQEHLASLAERRAA